MEHIGPIAPGTAPELDIVTEQQMRKPSVSASIEKPQVQERVWGFAARTDSTVTYEEYCYWAKIEREMEVEENKVFQAEHGSPLKDSIKNTFSKSGRARAKAEKEQRLQAAASAAEKQPAGVVTTTDTTYDALHVTDAEWRTCSLTQPLDHN